MKKSGILLAAGSKGWYQKYLKEGMEGFEKYVAPTPFDWSKDKIKRPHAYFSIKFDNEVAGKMVFELAEDVVPQTVENFKRLCKGDGVRYPGYRGTKIHLVRKGEVIMGGDIEKGDGKGNHSSYNQRYFEDENFIIPHSQRGLISMASIGVHTNGSQFYIDLGQSKHLNGRCVTFGRLVEGDAVLKAIETIFTHRGVPARAVIIDDCGIVS